MRSARAEHGSGRWYRVCEGAAAAVVVGCRARAAACSSACFGASALAQSASGCTARRVCDAAAACARRAVQFPRAHWRAITSRTLKSATCSASYSARMSPLAAASVSTPHRPVAITGPWSASIILDNLISVQWHWKSNYQSIVFQLLKHYWVVIEFALC